MHGFIAWEKLQQHAMPCALCHYVHTGKTIQLHIAKHYTIAAVTVHAVLKIVCSFANGCSINEVYGLCIVQLNTDSHPKTCTCTYI